MKFLKIGILAFILIAINSRIAPVINCEDYLRNLDIKDDFRYNTCYISNIDVNSTKIIKEIEEIKAMNGQGIQEKITVVACPEFEQSCYLNNKNIQCLINERQQEICLKSNVNLVDCILKKGCLKEHLKENIEENIEENKK